MYRWLLQLMADQFSLDLVDHFANNVGIMAGGLVEIVLMAWLLNRVADVRQYANDISDFSIGTWFIVCLKFITPIMLAIILATKLHTLFTEGYGDHDSTLGWAMIAALFVIGVLINATNKQEESL